MVGIETLLSSMTSFATLFLVHFFKQAENFGIAER